MQPQRMRIRMRVGLHFNFRSEAKYSARHKKQAYIIPFQTKARTDGTHENLNLHVVSKFNKIISLIKLGAGSKGNSVAEAKTKMAVTKTQQDNHVPCHQRNNIYIFCIQLSHKKCLLNKKCNPCTAGARKSSHV